MQKSFLERNVMLISGLAVAGIIVVIILGILLYGARELRLKTAQRYDQPVTGRDELPGPKNQISDRSKLQIRTLIEAEPNVIGGWATKLNYEKAENPIIYFWGKEPIIIKLMDNFVEMQESGRGFSSAELNARNPQSVRNSEEAKTGLIKCGPLSATNLPTLSPDIVKVAKGVCRATIPPFDANVNLSIVVVTSVDATVNTPEVQAIRRMLLQLQIDIFNRDYQGRETWAHEGTR